jgi:hypothetical protein
MRGETNDYRKPRLLLSVKTKTAPPMDTPFKTDEEALAFWDALVSNIRWRPDDGPRDGLTDSYPTDIKVKQLYSSSWHDYHPEAVAYTSGDSPHSGWWIPIEVDKPMHPTYVEAGHRMPYGSYTEQQSLVSRSWWGKKRVTTWQEEKYEAVKWRMLHPTAVPVKKG